MGMGKMIIGIDVSHHQKEMDFYKARKAGARFAFIRAGSCTMANGTCYTDSQFQRNKDLAHEYLPVGFYWYFRPNHAPIKQAEYFCSLIKDAPAKLPPVMDLETKGIDQSPASITENAAKFATRVYDKVGKWPLLYSRSQWLNANTVPDPIWDQLGFWVARYNLNIAHPWGDNKCIPSYYTDWLFWQYSDGGNGYGAEFGAKSKSIDLNYFNGDLAEFAAYVNDIPLLVQVSASWAVSLRGGPGGPTIGATWRGTQWPVLGMSKDGEYYKVEAWIKRTAVDEQVN